MKYIMNEYISSQRPDLTLVDAYDFYGNFDKIVLTYDGRNLNKCEHSQLQYLGDRIVGMAFVKNRKGVVEQWAKDKSIALQVESHYHLP
jgi:hypothetical protein